MYSSFQRSEANTLQWPSMRELCDHNGREPLRPVLITMPDCRNSEETCQDLLHVDSEYFVFSLFISTSTPKLYPLSEIWHIWGLRLLNEYIMLICHSTQDARVELLNQHALCKGVNYIENNKGVYWQLVQDVLQS